MAVWGGVTMENVCQGVLNTFTSGIHFLQQGLMKSIENPLSSTNINENNLLAFVESKTSDPSPFL
ncbi:hypothetical protein STEG23_026366, partial [Scotinomys teguina]